MSPTVGSIGDRADEIARLVERAVATIPFYADHLRDHVGVDSAGVESADVDLAGLPTCSKQAFSRWGQRPLAGTRDHVARYCATSGTTGPRQLVGFSGDDWDRLAARLGERGRMIGLGDGDLVANTHGYGLWIGGPALDLLTRGSGAALLPLGPGNTDQLLAWFGGLSITAMSATPSFMRYLAERIRSDGIDTSTWSLRTALVGGEGASMELRREVTRCVGHDVRWQELYGASEIGGPTLGWAPPHDPLAGRLLVDTDEFVVEVLHPERDEPVAAGELGEVTITTPYRQTDPLIRYRTRDLARTLPDVDDPSGFPSISTIVGRVDDALKIRGALVYPSSIEAVVVEHCADGAEWRIAVDREPGQLDTLTIVVEHDRPDADGLADHIHHAISVRPVLTIVAPGSLPRFEAKASRVTDHR